MTRLLNIIFNKTEKHFDIIIWWFYPAFSPAFLDETVFLDRVIGSTSRRVNST